MLLVRGLGGRQPLQRRALARRLQLNGQVDDVALGCAIRNLHMQRRAKGIRVRLQLPLGLCRVDVDRRHVDEARVEDDLLALLVGLALELQHHRALQALVLKVNAEASGGVLGAPSVIVGQRSGIPFGHGGDRSEAPPGVGVQVAGGCAVRAAAQNADSFED